MNFSSKNRNEIINNLRTEKYEVLIIGGGITGAGIALDAVSRGMKTALVEMQDFAAGTSSRSTKLVHGGLRYLKQFEVSMVAGIGKERAIVYENGPHVTTPEKMLLPLHKGGTFGRVSTSVGLRAYDFLAGVKKTERRRMLSVEETLKIEPLIKTEGLLGSGYYVEYCTDDARLTLEIIKKAVFKGVRALNYSKVVKLLYSKGEIEGVIIEDHITGVEYKIFAEKVINASGPWVDSIREKDSSCKGKFLQLTKGVHIVIDQSRFPLKQATYFDTPDGRMIFAIPREDKVYVGTTDTLYNSDPINAIVNKNDRLYLIDCINYMFPKVEIKELDIESSWVGVRPLIYEKGKEPSEISRKDEIWESESGLITIAGGKLTGYRKMAEIVVDLVAEKFLLEKNLSYLKCQTKNIPISGGDIGGSKNLKEFICSTAEKGVALGLCLKEARHLAKTYGSNVEVFFELLQNKEMFKIPEKIPLILWLKLQYSLDNELVVTPVDFFYRRTGMLLFNIDMVRQYKDVVISYMTSYFNWTQELKLSYTKQLENALEEACSING